MARGAPAKQIAGEGCQWRSPHFSKNDVLTQILTEHAQIATTTDTVKAELIFDSEHDHYQLA